MDTASATAAHAVRHRIGLQQRGHAVLSILANRQRRLADAISIRQCEPNRIRCNSLKMTDGATFYSSQIPRGAIRVCVVPVRVTESDQPKMLRLDNAETGHIRYSFALWLQERTARVGFSNHASEIP